MSDFENELGLPNVHLTVRTDAFAGGWHVRRANGEDAESATSVLRRSIVELCHADHNGDQGVIAEWLANKTADNMSAWISEPSNIVLVAVHSGAIVGIAAMTYSGHITLNYVAPEFRFRGISKALLARMESQARALGLSRLTLSSTRTAQPFYRSLGFVESGDVADLDKENLCLDMKKVIGKI